MRAMLLPVAALPWLPTPAVPPRPIRCRAALWQQVDTAQPEQRREFEPNSKQRKRRPAPSPPNTA
jgi:hypothetical protein